MKKLFFAVMGLVVGGFFVQGYGTPYTGGSRQSFVVTNKTDKDFQCKGYFSLNTAHPDDNFQVPWSKKSTGDSNSVGAADYCDYNGCTFDAGYFKVSAKNKASVKVNGQSPQIRKQVCYPLDKDGNPIGDNKIEGTWISDAGTNLYLDIVQLPFETKPRFICRAGDSGCPKGTPVPCLEKDFQEAMDKWRAEQEQLFNRLLPKQEKTWW